MLNIFLTDHPLWLVYFAPGVELPEATQSLRAQFGSRLIEVRNKCVNQILP